MKRFLLELFSTFSRLINVLWGGTADITFSARSHRDALWTEKWIDLLFFSFTGEVGHCQNWWQEELKRSERLLDSARDLKI